MPSRRSGWVLAGLLSLAACSDRRLVVDGGAAGAPEAMYKVCYRRRSTAPVIPPQPVSCRDVEQPCVTGGDPCNAFADTLRAQINACGVCCGEVGVGLIDGCSVDIRLTLTGTCPGRPTTSDQALSCLRKTLLGNRWACMPGRTEGWETVPVTCRIP